MGSTTCGGTPTQQLILEGNKIIIENIGVYDGSIPTSYRKETIYHFNSIEDAQEFYYIKRNEIRKGNLL